MHTSRQSLETARLRLRPFRLSDGDAAFHWFSDPEVMKYIPLGADRTRADTQARIGRYQQHERRHGFSKWLVTDRASGEPIGDAGFFRMPDGRPELGYRLARAWWGKGLATEAATKWLEVAREWLGLDEVWAYCHADHAASSAVAEKLGFQSAGTEAVYGWTVSLYRRDIVPA
jgi:RimJ/RimL family protein N-acetyltransferase